MSAAAEDSGTYPAHMMADAEREAEEARAAAGYPKPLPADELAVIQAATVARARERIAAGRGDFIDRVCVSAADRRDAAKETPGGSSHE
jgi:hypothetical protein